jgi:hypothetical protein
MDFWPAVNVVATADAYYFGFTEKAMRMIINVGIAAVYGSFVGVWKYSQGSGVLANLAGVTDGTNMFQNAGINSVSWTVPGDWATDTVNGIADLYWIVAYCTTSEVWGGGEVNPKGTQVWSERCYVGAGKVELEDPTGTDLFKGRILKVQHNQAAGTTKLICADWSHQLSERRVHYDMREDIDGSGLRQSSIRSDLDAATCVPVDTAAGPVYYIYDDEMSAVWNNDDWNGMYFVLPNINAGAITVTLGPSLISTTGAGWDDSMVGTDSQHLWVDDDNDADANDNGGILERFTFTFQLNVTEGSLFSSISAMRYDFTISLDGAPASGTFGISSGGLIPLHPVTSDSAETKRKYKGTIPLDLVSAALQADGTVDFYIGVTSDNPGVTTLNVFFAELEVDVITNGYSTAILIDDTVGTPARLDTSVDVDITGLGLWDGCKYSICKPIYKHIDSAEGGTLVTGYDPLVTITSAGNIEHTSGISSRHYTERTALEMLQDLAPRDQAVFYMALGTTEMYWVKDFSGAADNSWTDTDVLQCIMGETDYEPMRNEYHLYGIRIDDNQLVVDTSDLSPDPGEDSKERYGVTRSEVQSTQATSEYELESAGGVLVERDEDVHMFLQVEVAGLSTDRLGDKISITNTYLGFSSEVYVITNWHYDSLRDKTTMRLHPRSSIGYQVHFQFGEYLRQIAQQSKEAEVEKYIPKLYSDTWS